MSIAEKKAPTLIAWHIRKSGGKAYWDRVGAAFAHRDGNGFDMVLDALPIDGRVTLRCRSEHPAADDTDNQEPA